MITQIVPIDISYNNFKECFICLEPIINDDNGVYILECCKNSVHLTCLYNWYSIHKKHNNCFICNQYNSFCEDISNPLPVITDSSYIQIANNNVEDNELRIIYEPSTEFNRNFKIAILMLLSIVFIAVTMTLMFGQKFF